MFYKKYFLYFLLFFIFCHAAGRSIRLNQNTTKFQSVPDTFFLNTSKGNITLYLSETVYEDSISLRNQNLTIGCPLQLYNISDPYIRNAIISNCTKTAKNFNGFILSQKSTSCNKFNKGSDKIIGEVLAVGALGVATYAAVNVNKHSAHLKKLDELLLDLQKAQSDAISDLQKAVLINQINLEVYQLLSLEKENMLLFLNQIFDPFLMKPELIPNSISLMIEKQIEGEPNFYNTEITQCDFQEIQLNIKSYFGNDPITVELIKVETLGWFKGENYVEPYLSGLMVFHDNVYNNFDGSRCIHTVTNTSEDEVECLNDALWYNSRCNLNFYLTCAQLEYSAGKDFVKWKELNGTIEIVTKASHFYITKENSSRTYYSVPENGKFLAHLNKNEQIEVGPVIIHGKSNDETTFFIRESDISDIINNANYQIEKNNNFTKIVARNIEKLNELVKEDNANDGFWSKICNAANWVKDRFIEAYNWIKNNFIMAVVLAVAAGVFIIVAYCSFLKCCCTKKFGK